MTEIKINVTVNGEVDVQKIAEQIRQQIEKATKPEPLKVGDYAKVRSTIDGKPEINLGDIVVISRFDSDGDIWAERFSDGLSIFGFAHRFIKATDEEVAEAKRQQAEKAVAAKWASINRKPNEFKKGDIVEIIDYENGLHVGTLAEVRYVNSAAVGVNGVEDGEFCTCYGASLSAVKLVAPVESRIDR